MAANKKFRDDSWDFAAAYTKDYTHCCHNYPAMMIPQIAQRLIARYGSGARTLFDPYCGTGTSLVEANLQGINACGSDINPLARLIATVKTTPIELQVLDLYLKEFNDFLFSLIFDVAQPRIIAPQFKNIDFWFTPAVKQKLATLKSFIGEIADERIQNFFWVAFSETVRESSLTRNSEFKLYKISERQRSTFAPDVYALITAKLARNRAGLKNYLAHKKNGAHTHIYDFNSSEPITQIDEGAVDVVITSPPYGDSKTTVAYGQFSRLSNQWLGFENAAQVDNELMGGKRCDVKRTGIKKLDTAIAKIGEQDAKRAREVFGFYEDYANSIAHVAKVIARNGYACYVVGNRRVKDITLPTDEITKTMFEAHGFMHHNTIIRSIPHKRMPRQNSPTNQSGKTATTMNNEYIVVMQKTASV